MLKILQARLQQYVNRELSDVQAGFRKGRGPRDQIANIHWIIEKATELLNNIYYCFIDYAKAFDCGDHNRLWKILKEMGISDHLTCLLKSVCKFKKQQLEQDVEQWTGSNLRREHVSSVHFSHSVVSYSLRPHELQHTRPSCPSPTPRVHSNSRPSSR